LKIICINGINKIKKIKDGKEEHRVASMPPGFVAGFLLLRATMRAECNSGVQKSSHKEAVE
jgi:hypothetical protein